MSTRFFWRAAWLLWLGVVAGRSAERPPARAVSDFTNFPPRILAFCADKERQAIQLAKKLDVELPAPVLDYFADAKQGNWTSVFSSYGELREWLSGEDKSDAEQRVFATARNAALEIQLAMEPFVEGEPKYAQALGEEIVRAVARGAIYFGGNDDGRGLATAFSTSHEKADPFFTLTQNALADGGYLLYLSEMYGGKIQIPTSADSKRVFKDYIADAQRRFEHDRDFPKDPKQLRPGEDVRMVRDRVSVSGQVAVMDINGRLARQIFEANPDREFFVEESFPLDWMFPHLTPHGPILKLHRQPQAVLSASTVENDRRYWTEQARTKIGDWLKPETSVKEVCRFVERIYVNQELKDFTGDPIFVQKDKVGLTYAKLRSAIGGVYANRASKTKDAEEKRRMTREADFAFRQAFAFSPRNSAALFRYVNLLVENGRIEDALLVAKAGLQLRPDEQSIEDLVAEFERMKAKAKS